ncbi:hypothetical protein D3C87_1219690 [compost metagenome]
MRAENFRVISRLTLETLVRSSMASPPTLSPPSNVTGSCANWNAISKTRSFAGHDSMVGSIT